jgi:hypothetical protein
MFRWVPFLIQQLGHMEIGELTLIQQLGLKEDGTPKLSLNRMGHKLMGMSTPVQQLGPNRDRSLNSPTTAGQYGYESIAWTISKRDP